MAPKTPRILAKRRSSLGFSLVEIMLYVTVAVTVSVLSVVYGAKLVAEQDARNASSQILILQDTISQAYSFRADFTGLTTASFLSTHQAPAFLALADNSGLIIPEIKAALTVANERPSIPGIQKPAYAIFVRDLSTSDCSVIAARLGSSFSDIVVNGSSVVDSAGFHPDLAAASCASMPSGNAIKLISERTGPWVACRNLGTQFEEDSCPVGFNGVVTYSREYSCASNGGFEPGLLGPRTETSRVCCLSNPNQTDVRPDCGPGFTGSRTWQREYSCSANAGNEPGAWNPWHVQTDNCKADCLLPWGGSVAHASAPVTAYQSPSVPSGSSCVSETRSCDNGSLSGSYSNQNCTVLPPPGTSGTCTGTTPWGSVTGTMTLSSGAPMQGTLTVNAGTTYTYNFVNPSTPLPVPPGATSINTGAGSWTGDDWQVYFPMMIFNYNRSTGAYSYYSANPFGWSGTTCAGTVPPPDACANIAGNQTSAPANGYASGGVCSCNSGYTLNATTGACDVADACSNIPGTQTSAPANGFASSGSCSCNLGYTLNATSGMCDANGACPAGAPPGAVCRSASCTGIYQGYRVYNGILTLANETPFHLAIAEVSGPSTNIVWDGTNSYGDPNHSSYSSWAGSLWTGLFILSKTEYSSSTGNFTVYQVNLPLCSGTMPPPPPPPPPPPDPDLCSNMAGTQTSVPANSTASGGVCSCNPGYSIDTSAGTCSPATAFCGTDNIPKTVRIIRNCDPMGGMDFGFADCTKAPYSSEYWCQEPTSACPGPPFDMFVTAAASQGLTNMQAIAKISSPGGVLPGAGGYCSNGRSAFCDCMRVVTPPPPPPPPDLCSNIAGTQSAAPANGTSSGGVCSCNTGYTLDSSGGSCLLNTSGWAAMVYRSGPVSTGTGIVDCARRPTTQGCSVLSSRPVCPLSASAHIANYAATWGVSAQSIINNVIANGYDDTGIGPGAPGVVCKF